MDALEFIRERNRMCKSFGDGEGCMSCPFYKEGNRCMAILWKEEIIPIVEKWSKENPRKTRQSIFLEQYPNAKCVDGVVLFCPKLIDTCSTCPIDANVDIDCPDCRREFWTQEVK